MLPTILLLLLSLLKTSTAKLLLAVSIIAIAILHEMISILIDDDAQKSRRDIPPLIEKLSDNDWHDKRA
ncbi:uncharacterized protein DSM5745_10229 [Aspergillus mulundensis]|uniref:Uncharacterized protein n=1 Tax=Aspergillus mulundensis TaxID=1810919 RepID=A0A3D8QN65_9EURO|nr:hypothetical protein DSM5745_10229 [Aspergillus mulundensis]RDW63118.1 hypothetical protein DSM5745_10229 [Aspergillus mulundensis]